MLSRFDDTFGSRSLLLLWDGNYSNLFLHRLPGLRYFTNSVK